MTIKNYLLLYSRIEKLKFSKSAPKWLTHYSLDFNVSIEVIRRTILIKCDSVKVDDNLYAVKCSKPNHNKD